jgi:hypothetical protein
LRHKPYVKRLTEVSEALGSWIEAAQSRGELAPELPAEVLLYTLFARTCDPVLDYLKLGGSYRDEQIVDMLLTTTFDGLTRARTARSKSAPRRAA